MIYIDDTLGKRLWDELVFIERIIRTVPAGTINWEIIRSGIEKLLKESSRNGVVE
jgi:hypothetical protein